MSNRITEVLIVTFKVQQNSISIVSIHFLSFFFLAECNIFDRQESLGKNSLPKIDANHIVVR